MLTRNEAQCLILEADWPGLVRLHRHWIGHDEHGAGNTEALAAHLWDYVDECCDGDAVRANGPRAYDETGLTDPDAETPAQNAATGNLQTALSGALECWCAREGLPLGCAGEMLTHCGRGLMIAQREWLRAYITLWDLTNI